jgi:hypothetical protein
VSDGADRESKCRQWVGNIKHYHPRPWTLRPLLTVLLTKWTVTYQVKLLVFYSPMVHYHVHKSLPLTVIIIHMSVAYMLISRVLRSILILSSHLCLCLSSGYFTSVFLSNILHSFHTSPKWYLSVLILLDCISSVMFIEGYKLCPECSTCLLMFSDKFLYKLIKYQSLCLTGTIQLQNEVQVYTGAVSSGFAFNMISKYRQCPCRVMLYTICVWHVSVEVMVCHETL